MAFLPIPQDWDGESWCCWVVEWPDSVDWLSILSGYVTGPNKARTWDADTGSIIDVLSIGAEIEERNFGIEGNMTCVSDLSEGLGEIASALRSGSQGCGCSCGTGGLGGSGGTGTYPEPADEQDTGSETGDPPDGFDDWAVYLTFKCNMAQLILDDVQSDLNLVNNINVGAAIAGGIGLTLAPLLLTGLPLVVLSATMAVVVAAQSVQLLILDEIIQFVQDNEEELLCALHDGANTEESRNNVLAKIVALADQQHPGDPQNWAIKNILSAWFTTDNVNRLVDAGNIRPLPMGDCSNCGGPASPCTVHWGFQGEQDWVFLDQSDPGHAAAGFWANSRWTITLTTPSPVSFGTSLGRLRVDVESYGLTTTPGDTIVNNRGSSQGSASAGGLSQLSRLVVTYTDDTFELFDRVVTAAGQDIHVLNQAKTIKYVDWIVGRSNQEAASSWSLSLSSFDITLNLQDSPNCFDPAA